MRNLPDNERLMELFVADATEGLDTAESGEFDELLRQHADARRDELMQAAAIAQLAFLSQDRQSHTRMGLGLRAAVFAAAVQHFDARHAKVSDLGQARICQNGERRQLVWFGLPMAGWYVAAAVLLAALLFYKPLYTVTPAPNFAQQRATLMAQAPDVIKIRWGPSDQPGFMNVSGDVVWSNTEQKGFLRVARIPANDPIRKQYQLWIVDPKRDNRPIDGGVFDIASGAETIVPIDAKLAVFAPKAFAITLEQPGGVVVSSGPLLVVASVP